MNLSDLGKYSKALVPLFVAAVLGLLSQMGVSEDMSLNDVISLLITSAIVYFVPNKKL